MFKNESLKSMLLIFVHLKTSIDKNCFNYIKDIGYLQVMLYKSTQKIDINQTIVRRLQVTAVLDTT